MLVSPAQVSYMGGHFFHLSSSKPVGLSPLPYLQVQWSYQWKSPKSHSSLVMYSLSGPFFCISYILF